MKRSVLCHFHKRKPAKKLANKDIYLNPNNISQYPIRNSSLLGHFVWLHAAQKREALWDIRAMDPGPSSPPENTWTARPLNLWHILMIIMVMFMLICWSSTSSWCSLSWSWTFKSFAMMIMSILLLLIIVSIIVIITIVLYCSDRHCHHYDIFWHIMTAQQPKKPPLPKSPGSGETHRATHNRHGKSKQHMTMKTLLLGIYYWDI